MADIPYTPLADYGQLMQSYPLAQAQITNLQAQAGQANAQTGLIGQQTQGAAIANQKSNVQLDLIRQALNEPNQPAVNDQTPQTNASGETPYASGGSGSGGGGGPLMGEGGAAGTATDAATRSASTTVARARAAGESMTPTPGAEAAGGEDDTVPTAAGGPSTSAAASIGLDPAHVAKTAQQHFAVKDIWTQDELQKLDLARRMKMAGMPDTTQDVIAQHKARIDSTANRAQLQASDFYDQSSAIANAPDGQALSTLRRIHGDMANAIDQLAEKKGWTPEQTDQIVRDYATEAGNAAHRYSGRDIEVGTDGVARDKQTNQPVLGGNPVGLSQKDWSDLGKAADQITTVTRNGKETQVPQWQADNATSKSQWVNTQAHQQAVAQGRVPNQGPNNAAATAPSTATAVTTAPSRVRAAVAGLPADKAAFIANGPDAPSFLNTGTSKPNPGDTEAQQNYMKQRSAQLKAAGEEQQTAQTTLVNASRASAALDKSTTLGPGSGGYAELQTVFRNWTGQQAADAIENSAAMRQLLGKELGQDQLNTILSKLHGEGAQVRLGAQESNLILGALSANPDLSRFATKQMLEWEKSDAQYSLDKAKSRRAWVNSGKDLEQFDAAYEDQYPRSTNVKTAVGVPAAPTTGAPAQTFNSLPPAAQFNGKVLREKGPDGQPTGRRLQSDGTKWTVIPAGGP